MSRRRLVGLLERRQPAFGIFAPEPSAAGGAQAGASSDIDFVFYDLEEAPWDMESLGAFMRSMDAAARSGEDATGGRGAATGGERGAPSVLLRIPPVHRDPGRARERVAEALSVGVDGVILPQVESPEEVLLVAGAAGSRVWPLHSQGDFLLVVQIESRAAVGRAGEILGARGVAVGLPGQKDLRASYGGDEGAVQAAVDAVLAACDALTIPCGVTAGPHDVEGRLGQGFLFVIATPPGAVAVGRRASGRAG